MDILCKSYNSFIYEYILKHKSLLLFYNDHSNENNLAGRQKKLSTNKNILKITLSKSIFSLINNLITVKIGISYLKEKKIADLELSNTLGNKKMFLLKLYNKTYIISQLKSLKSLNYKNNIHILIYNIKCTSYVFSNSLKNITIIEKSRI